MSSHVSIYLLKDFPVLGKKGNVVRVPRKYANHFLVPRKIARKIEPGNTPPPPLPQELPAGRTPQQVLPSRKKSRDVSASFPTQLPPVSFPVSFRHGGEKEWVRWEWYPAHRLAYLPGGGRFVLIRFRKKTYFATFSYLQALVRRKIRAPLIVDGSNTGWVNGFPSLDPIFLVYDYIARDSEQFFFPLVWVFDTSFRRKLCPSERNTLDEFSRWWGVRVVGYADRMIFQMAREYGTRFLFSDDRFQEFFTEDYTRISFR
ncbi:MAG TPA: bL9 family ribosomal protein [Thermotogota bacterium]|nr:bL9 family ribosomal protein [Thermotogota bacterium]HRW91474.1 bL9 family ribosomal protein [Thermotogota bacterium]